MNRNSLLGHAYTELTVKWAQPNSRAESGVARQKRREVRTKIPLCARYCWNRSRPILGENPSSQVP